MKKLNMYSIVNTDLMKGKFHYKLDPTFLILSPSCNFLPLVIKNKCSKLSQKRKTVGKHSLT